MDKIFLSFSFREDDRAIVSHIERLIQSHSIQQVTGERLAGGALTSMVKHRIDTCDGLVSLLTRHQQLISGNWTSSDWVRDELNYARHKGKRAIALIEKDVVWNGFFGENEQISFNRESLADALIALSETIGQWKREQVNREKQPQQTSVQQKTIPLPPTEVQKLFLDTLIDENRADDLRTRFKLITQIFANNNAEPSIDGLTVMTILDSKLQIWLNSALTGTNDITIDRATRLCEYGLITLGYLACVTDQINTGKSIYERYSIALKQAVGLSSKARELKDSMDYYYSEIFVDQVIDGFTLYG